MEYKDYFSGHALSYAAARPDYPPELFAYLSTLCPVHELAWDCACGNGQATTGLVDYFEHIIATDASADQLAQAKPHPRILYQTGLAEDVCLAENSADLIIVAQALHWFDLPSFYRRVDSALKSSGVLAVWCYGLFTINPVIDRIVAHLYEDILDAYWPPERRHIENAYRDLPFPYQQLQTPNFCMTKEWSTEQVIKYLESWSATQRYMRVHGINPLTPIEEKLRDAWGEQKKCTVRWPLTVRVGYKR